MAREFMTFLKQYGVIAGDRGDHRRKAERGGERGRGWVADAPDRPDSDRGRLAWGFTVREQVFKIGPILAAGIDFLVVAWLVFHFSKKVQREEKVSKK
jgi:hypothetical protein